MLEGVLECTAMKTFAWALATTLSLVSSVAFADVLPPTVSACQGKAAGAECDVSSSTKGTCQSSTCSTGSCLECKQGATTTRPDAGSTAPATDDGGCALVARDQANAVGPWVLALAAPGIVFVLRRRKKRA